MLALQTLKLMLQCNIFENCIFSYVSMRAVGERQLRKLALLISLVTLWNSQQALYSFFIAFNCIMYLLYLLKMQLSKASQIKE